ncbi:hypothetical protein CSC33_1306 [Pseudomonas aeruginosa]|nr:hypothetical protein CSC33_1306 [Pseudomonas aeruginosa]
MLDWLGANHKAHFKCGQCAFDLLHFRCMQEVDKTISLHLGDAKHPA